jgi:hypothetical protein
MRKPMSLICPSLAANTITSNRPSFLFRMECRMEYQTDCQKQKQAAIFPRDTKKCELDS